ncbi:MAG: hypothetical protein LCH79_17915 [Proteobacteria bacterium]|jgi:hypothetical protein|nr:hypothetical protein [Ramlibacter sp.]MCA0215037.1 hypothetical protein [Pseudomonadota bacterium]
MAEPATIEESTEALFDVIVKVPAGTRLEDIERMALGPAGIRADRVESLIKALRSVPQAKIGAGVPRARADAAKEQFSKAGLTVEITPVLSIQVKTEGAFDGLFGCPSCKQRVALPENRQCPNCGVFVDKVTDEAQLRRRIMEQERAKLEFQASRGAQQAEKMTREQLEAQLRAEVRAELEAKMGIRKAASTAGKALKGLALVAVLAAVFIGGRGTGAGWSWEEIKGGSSKGKAAEVDKMLDSMGPPGGAQAAGTGAGGAAEGAGGSTGDPDLDDPLIQAAGGKRIGAKGLTMEQAVAASMTLAKSVGNTTAERALAGAAVGGGNAAGAGVAAAGASGAAAGGGAAVEASVSPSVKQRLALEFTTQLAEMGQLPRALQMIKALKASPKTTSDPAVASAARVADMEVRAWAMQSLGDSKARAAADALMSDAAALSDPAERAAALSRIGAILARHTQLPPEAARAFLTKAADSVKAIPDAQLRSVATGQWAVAFGEALLADANTKARAGQWSKVQQASAQVDTLIAQAPDAPSQARLYAIGAQLKVQLGQQDKALQSMESGLAQVPRLEALAERAALLRSMAQLSGGAGNDKLQAAAEALQAQATSKSGAERARALAQLSLLNADAGLRGKASELAEAARASAGLSPADAVQVNTDLIVRGDMAAARVLHSVGLYAESEAVLQRLGNYLL